MKPDRTVITHVFQLTPDARIEVRGQVVAYYYPSEHTMTGEGLTDITRTNLGQLLLSTVKETQ